MRGGKMEHDQDLWNCEQNTLTRHIFSWMHALSHTTLGQCCPHHVIHASCAVFVLTSLRPSTLHSSRSLSSSFSFSWSSSSPSMWVGSERSTLCASANEELGTSADNTPLTGYEPKKTSTTTTSQRPLKSSSRNPPATAGPRTCMTGKSVTIPSVERSLHQCSLRDKLTTLLKKVCCQVSRCLSVMLEQGDLFPMSLDHQFQTSGKIHVATQKMSKSGFFWKRADSRWLWSRDSEIWVLSWLWQKKYPEIEWSYRQRGDINRALAKDEQLRRGQQLVHEQLFGTKSRTSWSSWEKSQWDGRIEAISRLYIRYNFKKKIDRRSRHYPSEFLTYPELQG